MRATTVALVVVLVLAMAMRPLAQDTTGSIRGRVVDDQGLAVAGAIVTIRGPQGAKATASDGEGRFTIPFLTPGTYSVRAELTGFKAAETEGLSVGVGQQVRVSFKMDVGGVTQTVLVTAVAGSVDMSSIVGATLSTDMLGRIPVGRRVADTLYLVPGVSNSGTLGRMNPSIAGGSGLENQYVVDGANVTNVGYGGIGGFSRSLGSLGNAMPYDFIKEIQVKTGGYEAEFGQAMGGVVNVVTKSGSNVVRGSLFGYAQPARFQNAYQQYQATNGSVSVVHTSSKDVGGQGGGPLVKDHLFVFGALDPAWQQTTMNAPPGFALASLGDVDRDRRVMAYAGKATAQLGSAHRVEASAFGDPSRGLNGPQRTSSLLGQDRAAYSAVEYGGDQYIVRYDGLLGGHSLFEASFARSRNSISELPSVDTWRVTNQTVTPRAIAGGIGSYEKGNYGLSRQWTIKATDILGGHMIKYGFEYDDVQWSQKDQVTGPTFTLPTGVSSGTGARITIVSDPVFSQVYRVTAANLNSGIDTSQEYRDVFVQDSWRAGNRLTINLGIRYEQEKLVGAIVTAFELKNNWAPRIGLAYDAMGDGRTKLYGNYGMFYARVPNDLAARALSANASVAADYFDAALTRPIPSGTLAAGRLVHYLAAGLVADKIDPSTKLSYINEVVLGVERELGAFTLGLRYVLRNMPRVLEDVGTCPIAAYDLPATTAICGSSDHVLTNPSSATPINDEAIAANPIFGTVAFDNPVHRYNAVEFTVSRRRTNWSGMASYRYSRLRGNFEGFYRDDNGQSDPGISALYDFPTNDPTYASVGGKAPLNYPGDIRFLGDSNGILPLDRPHQIKLYGNYRLAMSLNLGVNLNMSSGKPLTPLAINPNLNYQNAGEIPLTPRGSGIQTVDGFKTRTPFESQVDLQVAWSTKFSRIGNVTFTADSFNLFNERRIVNYDQDVQLSGGTANPDFGKPVNTLLAGTPAQFQAPRSVRVGIRFEF